MKKVNLIILGVVLITSIPVFLFAQAQPIIIHSDGSQIFIEGRVFNFNPLNSMESVNEFHLTFLSKIEIEKMKYQYFINSSDPKAHPKFILPVKLKDGITDDGFYSISAYVDHDSLFPGYIQDYSCSNSPITCPTGIIISALIFFLRITIGRQSSYKKVLKLSSGIWEKAAGGV